MLVRLAEMAFQPLSERIRRLARRAVDRVRLARHPDRLAAADPRFDRAGLVVRPVLGAVLVADMDFDPRQLAFESRELLAHRRLDPLGDVFRAHHRTIGIELHLHGIRPFLSHLKSCRFNRLDKGPFRARRAVERLGETTRRKRRGSGRIVYAAAPERLAPAP